MAVPLHLKKSLQTNPEKHLHHHSPASTSHDVPLEHIVPGRQSSIVVVYLFCYNAMMLAGWIIILLGGLLAIQMQQSDGNEHKLSITERMQYAAGVWYARTGMIATILQGLGTLEVLHCAIGLLPSTMNTRHSIMLHMGRNVVVAVMAYSQSDHAARGSAALLPLWITWAVADTLRYFLYLLQTSEAIEKELFESVARVKKVRRIAPLILFPLGCALECCVMRAAMDAPPFDARATQDLMNIYMVLVYGVGGFYMFWMLAKKAFARKMKTQ